MKFRDKIKDIDIKEQQLSPVNLGTTDARMLAEFQSTLQRNEVAEVLKELFVDKKICMITDLSIDEIKLATSIYILAEMKNIKYWKDGIDFYMKLVLSKNRKSRKEILEAIRGYTSPSGILSKLNPLNWRDR